MWGSNGIKTGKGKTGIKTGTGKIGIKIALKKRLG
jgi:hypothetical protein